METESLLTLTGIIAAAMAGVGGIVAFTIKNAIGTQISKDLEKFKVRFSRLHEQQAEAIRDLYSAIAEVEDDIASLYNKYRPTGLDPPDIEEVDVIRRMRKLNLQFSKSRIFLDDQTCDAVGRVCGHLSSAVASLEQRRMFLGADLANQADANYKLEMSAFDAIHARIPEAKATLEKEFRRLLGAA